MKLATVADIRRELKELARSQSQAKLARDFGLSQPFMNQLVNDERGFEVGVNRKVLIALGYDPNPYYRRKK